MDLKCSRCSLMKRDDEFPVNNSKPKRGYRGYICLVCQRQYKKSLNIPPCTHNKICTSCIKDKVADDFAINKTLPTGRNNICKKCTLNYNKKRVHVPRSPLETANLTFIRRYKTFCGCVSCDYSAHYAALELDLDFDLKWPRHRLKAELRAKNRVICSNCLRIEGNKNDLQD